MRVQRPVIEYNRKIKGEIQLKMATVSDQKTLDCPLCFKTFSTPRILPCLHTFCEKCLGTHIQSQIQGGTKFTCPLCAAPHVLTDSNVSIDNCASSFPVNSFICSMMDLSHVSDKDENKCEPCDTDGDTTNADVWCINCREKMCRSCERLHKRNKQMKHHTTVPINEMNQHLQSSINFDQECRNHRERFKLFCVDHRKLCCAVCEARNHRQCNDVRSIDDIARDQSQQSTSDYPSIIRDVRKLKTEMEKILTEKKSNATKIIQQRKQILYDMNALIDNTIDHLNKLRNAFGTETDKLYINTECSIQEKEHSIQGFITNIENSKAILEILEKNGTPQQKFTTFENLRMQITSHYHQLNSQLKDDAEVDFTIEESKVLTDIEKTLNSVGSVSTSSTPSKSRGVLREIAKVMKNLDSRTKISSEMCAAQVQKQDLMASPVTFVKAVTTEKLGRGTWFTGGTYLADGGILMADCGVNKDRLVELDNNYNMVKEYKIDGVPTDVAAGNKDNEIYIAVNEKYIYKCTLHTNLTIVSRIKGPPATWGIAVSGDNIIVSTPSAVVILTQDGSTVRSIPKSGANSYVAVSQTQRTIYYKDNSDVICRTWGGEEMFRYQNQELNEPHGIDIDSEKNVYVCGFGSYNVHQVSSNGQRSRIIQLHSITIPWSVVVHPQKKELVVTSAKEDTVCEVYRLG